MSERGALAVLLLALGACRASSPGLREQLCRRSCPACAELCTTLVARADRAGCAAPQADYFSCLARTDGPVELSTLEAFDPQMLPAPNPGEATRPREQASGACAAASAALFSCMAPCRERGVVAFGSRRLLAGNEEHTVIAEQVSLGCERPEPELPRRAPAGSPCEYSSVCSATRCSCQASKLAYSARACVDGRCAGPTEACELVPRAVDQRACPSSGPRR